MAYVTREDVELRLGTQAYVQLTDDTGAGAANVAVVDAARAAAEGEVDSHLARRHRVPIDARGQAELAAVLAAVTLDIVEYRLHGRRPPVPEDVAVRYRAALAWLTAIAEGRAMLPSSAPLPGSEVIGLSAASLGNESTLSRAEFEGL